MADRGPHLIAFPAYYLHVTIGRRLKAPAPGLMRRSLIAKFAAVQTIDVYNPTPAAANFC